MTLRDKINNSEAWQKIVWSNLVFAVLAGAVVWFWFSWSDLVIDVYLGVILAASVTATVVGVIERLRKGQSVFGRVDRRR